MKNYFLIAQFLMIASLSNIEQASALKVRGDEDDAPESVKSRDDEVLSQIQGECLKINKDKKVGKKIGKKGIKNEIYLDFKLENLYFNNGFCK